MIEDDPAALPEHVPQWLDAMTATGGYTNASRYYEFRDGRRFVLPLARRRRTVGIWLGSFPSAWGIGGLVGKELDAGVVRSVLTDLRALGAAQIVLRPDPLAAACWADGARGMGLIEIRRKAHVIDLSGGLERVEARMHPSARRAIRAARRRGVTIASDTRGWLVPQYYELYRRSLDRWADAQHEPRALAQWRGVRRDPVEKLQVMAEKLQGRMLVSIAYHGGAAVAGEITLYGRSAHSTRGALDRALGGPVRASHLLRWTSIVAACEAGCTAFHLGESGESASLATFKERLGGRPVPYTEYRIERLPITSVDRAARGLVKSVLGFRDA